MNWRLAILLKGISFHLAQLAISSTLPQARFYAKSLNRSKTAAASAQVIIEAL
jgi:hypothetical protein